MPSPQETFCVDCQSWSFRSYCDPDFMMPEEHERLSWEVMAANEQLKKLQKLAGPAPRAAAASA